MSKDTRDAWLILLASLPCLLHQPPGSPFSTPRCALVKMLDTLWVHQMNYIVMQAPRGGQLRLTYFCASGPWRSGTSLGMRDLAWQSARKGRQEEIEHIIKVSFSAPVLPLTHFSTGSVPWFSGKASACNIQETWVWSLGLEDPWGRKWQPTPVFLPGEIPWTEEPGRLQSMRLQRVGHN